MNSIVKIKLIFLEDNFFHIAGIQKLADIKEFIESRNKKLFFKSLFKKSCKDKTINQICSSLFFNDIVDRMNAIVKFDTLLKTYCADGKYIKFCKNKLLFTSMIEYDYVLIITDDENTQYHYFVKNKDNNESIIRSAFINSTDNYWKNQKLMLLRSIYLEEDNKLKCIYKK